jgi:hypothetical protein
MNATPASSTTMAATRRKPLAAITAGTWRTRVLPLGRAAVTERDGDLYIGG